MDTPNAAPAYQSLVLPCLACDRKNVALTSCQPLLDWPEAESGVPQRAGSEDFLSQEVEKTELLRTADGHHACLQLLLEAGSETILVKFTAEDAEEYSPALPVV